MENNRIDLKIRRDMEKFEDFLHLISHDPSEYTSFLENPHEKLKDARIFLEDYDIPNLPPLPQGWFAVQIAGLIEELISKRFNLDAIIAYESSAFSLHDTESETNFDLTTDTTPNHAQMTDTTPGKYSKSSRGSHARTSVRFSGIATTAELYPKLTQGPLISNEIFEVIYSNIEKMLNYRMKKSIDIKQKTESKKQTEAKIRKNSI